MLTKIILILFSWVSLLHTANNGSYTSGCVFYDFTFEAENCQGENHINHIKILKIYFYSKLPLAKFRKICLNKPVS